MSSSDDTTGEDLLRGRVFPTGLHSRRCGLSHPWGWDLCPLEDLVTVAAALAPQRGLRLPWFLHIYNWNPLVEEALSLHIHGGGGGICVLSGYHLVMLLSRLLCRALGAGPWEAQSLTPSDLSPAPASLILVQ